MIISKIMEYLAGKGIKQMSAYNHIGITKETWNNWKKSDVREIRHLLKIKKYWEHLGVEKKFDILMDEWEKGQNQ